MTAIDLRQATLAELRADVSARTGRGINAIVAGIGLWTVFAILGVLVHSEFVLALCYVFGSGLLFPLSLVVAKLMHLDTYAKGNPLGTLAGLTGAVQILFIPLMLGAVFLVPTAVPWFLAVLVGAHFLPFAWLFASRAYVVAAIAIPVAAGLIGLLGPVLLPAAAAIVPIAAPLSVVVILAVVAILLSKENAADRA